MEAAAQADAGRRWVHLGRITAVVGLGGWVKVHSYTEPREAIAGYGGCFVGLEGGWRPVVLEDARPQGKALAVKLAGCDDRDAAAAVVGGEIAIPREQLPEPADGEYYWVDLEGLAVETAGGVSLGRVQRMMETGANDVMVVQGDRTRLVPFVRDSVVLAVDRAGGRITVDWDPDF